MSRGEKLVRAWEEDVRFWIFWKFLVVFKILRPICLTTSTILDRNTHLVNSTEISDHYVADAQSLEVNELNEDFIKIEPKEEDQSTQEQNIDVTVAEFGNCNTSGQDQKVMPIRQAYQDFALVAELYSLLEDYTTMACSGRSLLCCQPPVCHANVVCLLCGENFMGKSDRLLKLCKHFQLSHPVNASELILESMQRYGRLISHIRKSLEFDKGFGSINYEPQTSMSLTCYM